MSAPNTESLNGLNIGQIRAAANEQALEVLRAYWPEATFPVEPITIARRMGVEVFNAELGNDVFGMITGSVGGAQIYVDYDQPPTRYRFTVAHELGHYAQHQRFPADELAYVDRRTDAERGTAPEIFANQFAGVLLMPNWALEFYQGYGLNDYQLASQFGVSPSALSYRKQLLGS